VLHDPTVRMKELRDDRVHARMALVRDLWGLEDEVPGSSDAGFDDAEPEELAEVRALPQRRRR
jgi:hypothetical protein